MGGSGQGRSRQGGGKGGVGGGDSCDTLNNQEFKFFLKKGIKEKIQCNKITFKI